MSDETLFTMAQQPAALLTERHRSGGSVWLQLQPSAHIVCPPRAGAAHAEPDRGGVTARLPPRVGQARRAARGGVRAGEGRAPFAFLGAWLPRRAC